MIPSVRFLTSVVLSLLVFTALTALPCAAGEPADRVKEKVDAIVAILDNPDLKKPENTKLRHDKIRSTVETIFDFNEMSRRALAVNWKQRTPQEQKEFVSLFSDLLEDTYIRKVEQNYSGQKVLYLGEQIQGAKAEVKTKITAKGETEIPINYRLMQKDGKWVVYDVIIEGVSLVNNYRSQFRQILTSGSWQDLITRLKSHSLKEPVA